MDKLIDTERLGYFKSLLDSEIDEKLQTQKEELTRKTYEHVKVVCRAASGTEDQMQRVSTEGGKVHVKRFFPSTCEEVEEEFTIPANGVVELDIPYGWHYQIHSTLTGYGASFRLTFTACTPLRWAHLWNLEIGTYLFGTATLVAEDSEGTGYRRLIPGISTDGTFHTFAGWDVDNGNSDDYDGAVIEADSESDDDDPQARGIAVISADVSVLIESGAKADETKYWSKQNFGRSVPGLKEYYTIGNYKEAKAAVSVDYDGNLNTDKILDVLQDCPAALFACQSPDYQAQRYLPSVGELSLLYTNKAAYNAIQAYYDVPALDTNWYWSSCANSTDYCWGVGMGNGDVGNDGKDYANYVLAASAFKYNYY